MPFSGSKQNGNASQWSLREGLLHQLSLWRELKEISNKQKKKKEKKQSAIPVAPWVLFALLNFSSGFFSQLQTSHVRLGSAKEYILWAVRKAFVTSLILPPGFPQPAQPVATELLCRTWRSRIIGLTIIEMTWSHCLLGPVNVSLSFLRFASWDNCLSC